MKKGNHLGQGVSGVVSLFKKQFKTSKGRVSLAGFFILIAATAFIGLASHAQGLSRSGEIRITSANEESYYGSQSVIVLGPSEEPSINISKYYHNKSDSHKQLKVSLYRIQQEDLLKFLIYSNS